MLPAVPSAALAAAPPAVILNATGFAVSTPGAARETSAFDAADCPVLQVVFSGGDRESWQNGTHGLSARDIAMSVALPEVDGRVLTRAVSFKGRARRDPATETDIVHYEPVADRIDFVARLAAAWAKLRGKPPAERRIAIVLANYPNRDGRLGNGVGLDTPAGTMNVLRALADAGYRVEDIPADGDALIHRLAAGPTNDWRVLDTREWQEELSLIDYSAFVASLPEAVQRTVADRWGPAEQDPFYRPGELDCGRFAISAFRLGNNRPMTRPPKSAPRAINHCW